MTRAREAAKNRLCGASEQSIWDATRLERFFVDVLRSWPVILAVGVVVAIVFAVVSFFFAFSLAIMCWQLLADSLESFQHPAALLTCVTLQVWLIMLRFFGGVMVVLTIILINAALVVSSLVCFSLAGKLGKAGQPGEVTC